MSIIDAAFETIHEVGYVAQRMVPPTEIVIALGVGTAGPGGATRR